MIKFGLYKGREETKLCHIFISEYHGADNTTDLCGSDMQIFVVEENSLYGVRDYKICQSCKNVYTMLELAE